MGSVFLGSEPLSKREFHVLVELLKNSRISDQEIARRLNTSRPGIAKIRQRLEKKGVVLGYQPIVDFEKLGLTVHAITLYRWMDYSKQKELSEFTEFVRLLPEVFAFVQGEGGGKTNVVISLHATLPDFEAFVQRLKVRWKNNVDSVEMFISSISGLSTNYRIQNPVVAHLRERLDFDNPSLGPTGRRKPE